MATIYRIFNLIDICHPTPIIGVISIKTNCGCDAPSQPIIIFPAGLLMQALPYRSRCMLAFYAAYAHSCILYCLWFSRMLVRGKKKQNRLDLGDLFTYGVVYSSCLALTCGQAIFWLENLRRVRYPE
jgi:hypothetical protein